MPVILATWEAEIRRITVRSQPRQIVHETLSRKNPSQKRASRVAQGVGLEFKPQYCKKRKKEKEERKKERKKKKRRKEEKETERKGRERERKKEKEREKEKTWKPLFSVATHKATL
jgi:UDP-N-acetylglucosamine:LPS N-acetylglucosamine transferase